VPVSLPTARRESNATSLTMYSSLYFLSLCLLICINICCVSFFWLCLSLQKPVKKKGSYPLHPGVQGFFITCDGGRERQASREAINVIDSVCFYIFFYLRRFFLLLFFTKFNQDKLKIDSCGDKHGGWLWEKDLLLCSKKNSFVAAPLNQGFEFLCQARFVYGESLRTGRATLRTLDRRKYL